MCRSCAPDVSPLHNDCVIPCVFSYQRILLSCNGYGQIPVKSVCKALLLRVRDKTEMELFGIFDAQKKKMVFFQLSPPSSPSFLTSLLTLPPHLPPHPPSSPSSPSLLSLLILLTLPSHNVFFKDDGTEYIQDTDFTWDKYEQLVNQITKGRTSDMECVIKDM